ncbi:Rho termination factor N-terminal domain-containing protein [uncultured Ruminococcus sp.]|uniref:Rho termination factor N-terminal domain-containing protein n=1 Tax=uncultured Ruminococcus sp. TaxID=165186 RepID=UPI0025DCB161|nr:Rho termination factor N-terminal domain-containing protein [uncultured Ruminococcus sp.]
MEEPTTEFAAADTNSDNDLSQAELEALTVAQLRSLAAELEITLTATTKAEIIAEILAAQSAAPEQQTEPEQQPGG